MKDINLEPGKVEIETKDDNFERLPFGNKDIFDKFLIIMKNNPKASQMSIRAFIHEQEGKNEIVDYEFFFREKELKANKNIFGWSLYLDLLINSC